MKTTKLNRVIISTSLIGILISTYALYVEMLADVQPGYTALCDISEHASCSKVLTSKYAKGLGLLPQESPFKVPNCVYGIIFYSIIIFLTTFDQVSMVRIQLGIEALSLLTCVYLAYILIFILHDFCVVCVSTYIVNIVNAIAINKKLTLLTHKEK